MNTRRQVKFETDEAFYERLQEEKVLRNLTIQQIVVRALERYLAVSEPDHQAMDRAAKRWRKPLGELVRRAYRHFLESATKDGWLLTQPDKQTASPTEQDKERFKMGVAMTAALNQFPPAKLKLLIDTILLDLKYYRSARLKPEEAASETGKE